MKKYQICYIILICLLIMTTGCSHQLNLKNPDDYYSPAPFVEETIIVGVLSPSSASTERLINEIVDNMRVFGNVKVIYPYANNTNRPADYILDFKIHTDYKGDGNNFFVSFPGFVIFAPWWHGFSYFAEINTKVTISDYKTAEIIHVDSYDTKYQCVHSEFDRTWTQGVDWCLTYGACSLIGGIVFINYDEDITSDFERSYSQPLSSYISRKVLISLKSLNEPEEKNTITSCN